MCVLQFSSQRKLFNFVYLHIKGFVLSFHQRFYEPHSNSESVQKHLNFMYGTLIPGKRFWPVAWIFCENCRQFSIRDSCTHSYCMANFVIGNFLGSKYFQTFAFPSHLGPVSTIFDWLILQPPKKLFAFEDFIFRKKTTANLTGGLMLDQPLLVVKGRWSKEVYIHHVFGSGVYQHWQ